LDFAPLRTARRHARFYRSTRERRGWSRRSIRSSSLM